MYRHRPRVLKLNERIKAVACGLSVKADGHRLLVHVYGLYRADVPVEHPGAGLRTVLALPEDVVIVPYLHDPVSLAENSVAEQLLLLLGRAWVQHLLELLVEVHRAHLALARGREHLNVLRRDVHLPRQTHGAKLRDRLNSAARLQALEPEKVSGVLGKVRVLAAVYHVRVADYPAVTGLAEYLRQAHRRHDLAADERREHIARSDRRQLIGVAHHDEPCIRRQRAQQRVHQADIHHRALVKYHRVTVEPVALVLCEHDAVIVLVEFCSKHAVYRRGVAPGELRHALCRAPCRCAQERLYPDLAEHRKYRADRRRLAGAGAAGYDQQLVFKRQLQRLPLHRRAAYPLLRFELCEELCDIRLVPERAAAHTREVLRGVRFRLVQLRQVACAAPGYLLVLHIARFDKPADALIHILRLHTYKLRRRRGKLLARDEAVAVSCVVRQLEQQRRVDALAAAALHAELQRHRVGLGKGTADERAAQHIGVLLERLHGLFAVEPVHTHRKHRAQPERAHELHQHPDTRLLSEACGYLLCLGRAYPLYRREVSGRGEHHVKRPVAEAVDYQRRRRGAYAFH